MPNNTPTSQNPQVQSSSVSKFFNWVKQGLSLTTTAADKTMRQSVSNPSSPTLVKAKRLVSASADNIFRIMDDDTFMPTRSQIINHQSNTKDKKKIIGTPNHSSTHQPGIKMFRV